jgi:hypothetical protein
MVFKKKEKKVDRYYSKGIRPQEKKYKGEWSCQQRFPTGHLMADEDLRGFKCFLCAYANGVKIFEE